MKVNTKNFIKRLFSSFVFVFVFLLAGVFVSNLSSGKTAIYLKAQYIDMLSPYNDCDYDYIIRGLSDNQIDSINNLESVSDSVCYHNTNATIKTNNEEIDISILSLTDDNKAYLTEYSPKRVIESKTSINENTIFIYEQFSKVYDIKIGDTIKIAGVEFEVSKIFRDNVDNVVYIPNFENILKNLFSQELSISGIYVSCSNKAQFASDFLSTYKPLASLKGINDFDTIEEYESYLVNFNSKDYTSFYKDKIDNYNNDLEKAKELLNESKKYSAYSGLLVGGFMFLGSIFFVLINIKRIKVEIVSNGRKELIARTILLFSSILTFSIIATLINLSILIKSIHPFINFSSAFSSLLYEWILLFAFILLSFLINFVLINRKRESIK